MLDEYCEVLNDGTDLEWWQKRDDGKDLCIKLDDVDGIDIILLANALFCRFFILDF